VEKFYVLNGLFILVINTNVLTYICEKFPQLRNFFIFLSSSRLSFDSICLILCTFKVPPLETRGRIGVNSIEVAKWH